MKKQEAFSLPAIGASSLLVMFGVLCLTVFSLLCLSTVLMEKRLSDASAQNIQAYYAAELEAQQIFGQLRAGRQVPGVTETEGRLCYSCPMSPYQTLEVELQKNEEGWKILRWQVTAHPEETEEVLPVWDGR